MANINTINDSIIQLAASERITKALLGELSRSLLEYVVVDKTYDIDAVNRCIAVLTPMNKRTAALFFPTFLPFTFDEGTFTFGKMIKQPAAQAKKVEALEAFLAVEQNSIWSWAEANIDMAKKVPKYAEMITKTISRALADEENGLTAHEVLAAIIASDGLTLADIMAELGKVKADDLEQA